MHIVEMNERQELVQRTMEHRNKKWEFIVKLSFIHFSPLHSSVYYTVDGFLAVAMASIVRIYKITNKRTWIVCERITIIYVCYTIVRNTYVLCGCTAKKSKQKANISVTDTEKRIFFSSFFWNVKQLLMTKGVTRAKPCLH